MKRIVLGASALALLCGLAFAAPASAAQAHRHYGSASYGERAAIARSAARLGALQRQVRANGHVTRWERARIRIARSNHGALAYRLRHN